MTLPDERTRALLNARRLLSDVAQMKSTADVTALREKAVSVLRHYPDDGMVALIARKSSWLDWPCHAQDALSQRWESECTMAPVVAGLAALPSALTASKLLQILADADPESRVLFMTHYADADESDEVREVFAPETSWTHEHGWYMGGQYSVWYPGSPESREVGYRDVTYETVRVVVLSDGPTNLRFVKPS